MQVVCGLEKRSICMGALASWAQAPATGTAVRRGGTDVRLHGAHGNVNVRELPVGGMQLGGSLIVTFTVPMPETMLWDEPPLQLTMIPAIAKSPPRQEKAPQPVDSEPSSQISWYFSCSRRIFLEHSLAGRGQTYRLGFRPGLGYRGNGELGALNGPHYSTNKRG